MKGSTKKYLKALVLFVFVAVQISCVSVNSMPLGQKRFHIIATGNINQVQAYALVEAAEIALENGYSGFYVGRAAATEGQTAGVNADGTPSFGTQAITNGIEMTIELSNESDALNANDIIEEYKPQTVADPTPED